jgi:hypothetical protein
MSILELLTFPGVLAQRKIRERFDAEGVSRHSAASDKIKIMMNSDRYNFSSIKISFAVNSILCFLFGFIAFLLFKFNYGINDPILARISFYAIIFFLWLGFSCGYNSFSIEGDTEYIYGGYYSFPDEGDTDIYERAIYAVFILWLSWVFLTMTFR